MSDEILKADPKHRVRLLGLALGAALLGLGALFLLQKEMQNLPGLLETAPEEGAQRFLLLSRLIFGAMAAGIFGMGLYMLRLGRKTLASGTFPPPGTWVLQDTPVLRDAPARRKAKVGMILGILLLILGLWMPYHVHRTFKQFIGQELKRINTVPREIYPG